MTDKQIIIDGIDVSVCPHIEYEYKWWNIAGHERNSENVCALSFDKNTDFEEDFLCQDNPNCYYKQLKRKEQECEGLKEEIKIHNDDMFKNPPEKRFYCKGCTLPYISKKQSQTLTEIKPILEFYANSKMGEEQPDRTYKIMLSGGYIMVYDPKPARQALQKISEVLE